uniref:PAN2-PAN3 deadenylation complex subunit PAN3 n=1 Tax=Blastobotrys adeninivorans TaxID=409370 RepID=A0A060T864_BLAAD
MGDLGGPKSGPKPDTHPPPGSPSAVNTPCRNVLIHGFCKYADKGCVFRHDNLSSSSGTTSPSKTTTTKKKLNADSPAFTPSAASFSPGGTSAASSRPGLSPRAVSEAPRFIPKFNGGSAAVANNGSQPSFNPENMFSPRNAPNVGADSFNAAAPMMDQFNGLSVDSSGGPHQHPPPPPPPPQLPMHPGGHDMMFQHHTAYPLQYHLYAPKPDYGRMQIKPHQRVPQDFFISDSLREDLQRKNEATLQKLPGTALPEFVHVYHTLVPLDLNFEHATNFFGYQTWAYKATSNHDGRVYCLRRIEGFRLTNERAMQVIKLWCGVDNPGLVHLHEAFTTLAFGDNSVMLVYDYHPLSKTLRDEYFTQGASLQHYNSRGLILENIIWNYAVQLVTAIRSIHEAHLAAQTIDPTKILVTGQGRVRVNCCGLQDLVEFEKSSTTMEELQANDWLGLGKVLLSLACNSIVSEQGIPKGLELVKQFYSEDLYKFLTFLLSKDDTNTKTVDSVVAQISHKMLDVVNGTLSYNDRIEAELGTELENGRVARLMAKLGFINERPEYKMDPMWSESGERYVLKLFRDYVFHQVNEEGRPVVDLGHVLSCLNKLDAGIDESIMLVSRDEQNCLIVTYKELKTCIDNAFRDLTR